MTCKMVQKYLPLLAGGDLTARKERKLLGHLDRCPGCREELEGYRNAIGRVKAAARQESAGDWSGAEWKALMARATAQGTEKAGSPARLRPRWALASGVAALLVLAVLVIRITNTGFKPEGAPPAAGPDVVSVTMVSHETGLQVVWFFNKNFDWKGDQK